MRRRRNRTAGSHDTEVRGLEDVLKTVLLFVVTAFAELVGCYLPYLWLRKDGSPWLLLPAAVSLTLFAWLLTLHPTAAGRVYAAYGGVYVTVALGWLWGVDGIRPGRWDCIGVALCLAGMGVIMFASENAKEPDQIRVSPSTLD